MNRRLILFLKVSLFFSMSFSAQVNELLAKLPGLSDADTVKSYLLCDIANGYYQNANYDSAFFYAYKGYEISKKQKFVKGIYKNLNVAGLAKSYLGNYKEAVKLFNEGLLYTRINRNKKGEARLLNSMGTCQTLQANYNEGINYFLRALKIEDSLGGNQKLVGNLYNNIGVIYNRTSNFGQARIYHRMSLAIRKILKDSSGIALSYNNLANTFGYHTKERSDSVLYYLTLSLEIRSKLKNEFGIAQNWNNLGNYYLNTYVPDKALELYYKAYVLFKKIGAYNEVINTTNNLADVYYDLKNYKESEKYAEEAFKIAKESELLEYQESGYKRLAKVYLALGKYKQSAESYREYVAIKDTFFSQTLDEKLTEARYNFEYEKKEEKIRSDQEKKDAITLEEKRIQSIVIYCISGGAVLLILFLLVLYKGYSQKRKANFIITAQKHIVEEKHKEITDSINYAERIQRSFLASKDLLNQNLEEHFVFFQPKDVVSGDFYWAGKLSNGNFALVTADSTGHGVPGAIMSILNISSLEKAIEQGLNQPSEILNHTRKTIIERLKKDGSAEGGKDGMDCSLICFDFKNRELIYAAANNPVWLIRENNLIELLPDKMPVGKHDKDQISFTQHEFELQQGDLIYVLTDGMPDQFGGPKGKKFMYKRLKEFLISISQLPMEIQKQKLSETLTDWKGDLEQVDDICLIGIKV